MGFIRHLPFRKVNFLGILTDKRTSLRKAFLLVFNGFLPESKVGNAFYCTPVNVQLSVLQRTLKNIIHSLSLMLQSYLWNDNKSVVEWLEKELSQTDHSVIDENVKWISRDWILRQIKT